MPDHLSLEHLVSTIGGYSKNNFVQFLFDLFPDDQEAVESAIREYRVGTEGRFTVFPVIDVWQRFCKAQLIRYDRSTGRRIKDEYSVSSIQSRLKAKHLIDENFETDKNIFFGEHLLKKYPGRPIAIVEAPKTAVIASICKGVFPYHVWLACLGKNNLNVHRIERLGRDRLFHLFPDTKGYDNWLKIASAARKRGLSVRVSDVIQANISKSELIEDLDLADYLIYEQARRNDPVIRERFRVIIEQQLANLRFDGGLTLEQAEAEIVTSGFYKNSIRFVLNAT